MNEEIEVLKSIFSRPNELIVDEQTETIRLNVLDEETIAFSIIVSPNRSVLIEAKRLNNEILKKLRQNAQIETTIFDLFLKLKTIFDETRQNLDEEKSEEIPSKFLVIAQIDHIRSETIYLKNLRQWTEQFRLSGRVFIVASQIFLFFEGENDDLKVTRSRQSLCCFFFCERLTFRSKDFSACRESVYRSEIFRLNIRTKFQPAQSVDPNRSADESNCSLNVEMLHKYFSIVRRFTELSFAHRQTILTFSTRFLISL